MRLWTLDWGYDHLRLRLWSLHWRRKIIPKPARPCSTCPFFYEISGTSWFFFFSGVIIASVEGDHSPSKVFIASWSTLFMHEILCMKMIIAMNCCCSCMIFWIMAMKDYWSWMISTDRCIISWPLKSGRNGFSRGEEHLANQEAADENKSILKLNSIHHHNGREVNFTMKVTDVHSSCLDRQVTERVNIENFQGPILMNRRSEMGRMREDRMQCRRWGGD